MREVLAQAYPPNRSVLRHIIAPVLDPWTYLRGVHLFLMFEVGLVYFVALVVLLSFGVALSWTLLGPPILLVALYLSRWAGDIEAWGVRHLHHIELRRPPTTIERGSYRSQVWARIIDPTTWTGLVYLVVQFPLGLAVWVIMVVLSAVGGALAIAPLIVGPDTHIDLGFARDGSRWVIDNPRDAWWLPFVGLTALLVELHLVNVLSAAHAWWARLMLGSRAPHIVPGAPLDDLPPTTEGGPDGSDGTDGTDGPPRDPGTRGPAPTGSPAPAFEVAPASAARLPPSSLTTQAPLSLDEASTLVLASLTPREIDVLRLLSRGYSNAEIAEAFVISEGTVKTHVKRVLAKLEVRDRTQAAVWAFDRGFVLPALARPTSQPASAPEPLRLRAPR